jgi:hypothetical protein
MADLNEKQFRKVGNIDLYKAMLGFRSSGAAGTHKDKRTKRLRTRQASNLKAVKQSEGEE